VDVFDVFPIFIEYEEAHQCQEHGIADGDSITAVKCPKGGGITIENELQCKKVVFIYS
jgi:hypothetical protein